MTSTRRTCRNEVSLPWPRHLKRRKKFSLHVTFPISFCILKPSSMLPPSEDKSSESDNPPSVNEEFEDEDEEENFLLLRFVEVPIFSIPVESMQ